MKNWQIVVLCFSIIVSVIAAAFYLKYEPKTFLTTNYGPVHLGQVFSEKVMIDVTIVDKNGDLDGNRELMIGSSFYDKTKPVDKALLELSELYNRGLEKKDRLKYDEMSPKNDDTFKLEIRTYIIYSSSNFASVPYTLTVSEETYRLPSTESFKYSVDGAIESNFKNEKEEVANHLFITDKVAYGLEEGVDTK